MIIGTRDLKRQRLLLAEIGNNHEGDPVLALEMVAAAAEAGADAVKIQVIDAERLINRSQAERVTQLSRFKLPQAVLSKMADVAKEKGVLFIASAFDLESLGSIAELVDALKIASGDLDFGLLLSRSARMGKPIILSTGMGTLQEIRTALDTIGANLPNGHSLAQTVALLHCVSLYPTPLTEANLRAIETLRATFDLTVGYSDHTLGIEAALISLALGARIIEKHFTLDKTRTAFRDHALSADPDDLGRLAAIVRNFDDLLGSGEKKPSAAERESLTTARRSIVAARDLSPGTHLTLDDLDFVRPQQGLSPLVADVLVGRIVRTRLKVHDLVVESALE